MSEHNNLLRLDRIQVRNFRCFSECSLDLHPKLTVLVAENGQGKTALLDAIRIGLNPIVTEIGRAKLEQPFQGSDMHKTSGQNGSMRIRLPVGFKMDGQLDNVLLSWNRELLDNSGTTLKATFKGIAKARAIAQLMSSKAEQLESDKDIPKSVLPVIAYYGTGRLFDEHRLTAGKRWLAKTSPSRVSAYLDCLSPSSSYKSFAAWFGEKWEQLSSPTSRAIGFQARPENHLAAVRDAIRTVLDTTGWTTIDWQTADTDGNGRVHTPGYIAVEHAEKGRLPLTFLSDGVRNMVALAGDLAHRCIRLNPHLGEGAAKQTPGVVLIDEIDMHLHPQWQQKVVGQLREAFPKLQLILTTHSPHVLTTVDAESIRIINVIDGIGSVVRPQAQTSGDESGNVLSRAMHVNPVPDVGPARLLSEYRGLIQNGLDRSAHAQEVWQSLVTHFGEDHHLLHEAAVLRDLQEFKREYAQRGGAN